MWIEHGTHGSCSEPVWWWLQQHSRDQQGPSLATRTSTTALPCPRLLGCCWQEKMAHFLLTPFRAVLHARVWVSLCLLCPLFILLGLKVSLGGKVLFWAVSVQGRQHKGMLCLPGCACMNR